MNRLSTGKRAQVIAALVEGNSINATCRMFGVGKHTVLRLLEDAGCACAAYHHQNVRGVRVRRLQADEIWAFVGAKRKNVTPEQEAVGWGDVWTWTAIDADTKLIVTYYVGDRGKRAAYEFMTDCAERKVVSADPAPKHVSTSYVERQNLTMRMSMRRFTRLTNGFSKKFENHAHQIALYFFHYNFCRVHKTLRVTPAMEAGLTNHVWTLEELCALIPDRKPNARAEREMLQRASEA
jgi:IS1 family transposase